MAIATYITLTTMLRMSDVLAARGVKKSRHYEDIKAGLFTSPVKQGRSSVWPITEIETLNRAVISGKSDSEIKQLVAELMAARTAQGKEAA